MLRCVVSQAFRAAAVCLLASLLCVTSVADASAAKKRKSSSSYSDQKFAAMVIDGNTGRVLYAKNEDARRYPASITKVMTLYLLFEALEKKKVHLGTEFRVSAKAAAQAPSKLGLQAGDTIEVEDAIKALVTKSANDVAMVVAENLAGSEAAFAQRMTRKAKALGMKNTVYRNPSGLPNPQQVTTARDLIILSRAVQDRFPRYYRYFATESFAWGSRVYNNHNKLLGRVEGIDGIKTGYTNASGFNLTSSLRSDGRHLIAVVLGGRTGAQRDATMRQLLAMNLPKAYAGKRTAPRVAELNEDSDDALVTASIEDQDDVATTASLPKSASTIATVQQGTSSVLTQQKSRISQASLSNASLPNKPSAIASSPAVSSKLEGDTPKSTPQATKVASLAPVATNASVSSLSKSTGWVMQLGAMPTATAAQETLQKARGRVAALSKARPYTESIKKGNQTLHRARFAGLEKSEAENLCQQLKKASFACMVMAQ